MQSMRGKKPPMKSKRQTLISNFTSQRLNGTQETILAHDTQPSQQGNIKFANVRPKCSERVPCSQVGSLSDSDEDIIPIGSSRPLLNNSMRAFRAIIDDDSDDDNASCIKETSYSQIPSKPNDVISDDVVYDSQEEKSDGGGMNLDDVHSQMSFRPPHTSTQREFQDDNVSNTSIPVDRKRKKTSALSDRPAKKSLSKITKTFDIPSVVSSDYSRALPSKRLKSSDSSKTSWISEGPSSSSKHEEPQIKRKIVKVSEDKNSSQYGIYKDVDISQISTGKSYDVEEPDSFLHQLHNRTSMFSINDISRVVENMKDMVETMKINRSEIFPSPNLPKEANMSNVKKFRKAPQGRYNPALRCSENIIGKEDLKDFRTF